ncbi:MAG: putative quinol monooxygenase [Acidimicrobiales bacterium]
MAKVAIIAKITALPGKRDEVVATLSEMVDVVKGEPGTEVYALNIDKADENSVWFYEVYTDEASMAAHGGSEAMKAVGGRLRDKAAGRPELTLLELVAAKGVEA